VVVRVNKKQGCSMIFVSSSGHVLLCLRDDKPQIPYPGKWDLLGGHMEEGESPEECIRRELLEEIEYDLKQAQLFRVSHLQDSIEHTYWCEDDLDIARTPLHEGQRLCWFSEDEILAMPEGEIAFEFKSVLELFFRERRAQRD
jgi:8-oxo-dGTP diphosphatase